MKFTLAIIVAVFGVSIAFADIRPPIRAQKTATITISGQAAREIWRITQDGVYQFSASCAANGTEYSCTLTAR
jgi:hypothetical protein